MERDILNLKHLELDKSKKGFPVIWESGGGNTNTGKATIITDAAGNAKKAFFLVTHGERANKNHALFYCEPGDHIIKVEHQRDLFKIGAYQVDSIYKKLNDPNHFLVDVNKICIFNEGKWDKIPPHYLNLPIQIAREKALTYHCKDAMFNAITAGMTRDEEKVRYQSIQEKKQEKTIAPPAKTEPKSDFLR